MNNSHSVAMVEQLNWHTERLTIRRFKVGDFDLEMSYQNNPEIMRYIADINDTADKQVLIDKVKSRFEPWQGQEGEWLGLAICLAGEDKHIGLLCLRYESIDYKRVEIGYRLHPDYHGKGYISEAASYACEFLFNTLNVHKIVAYCVAEHKGSYRVMEKLGMQREAVLRAHATLAGQWHDELVYGLLASEYKSTSKS